jgi:pyruvate-formate lyase
MEGKPEFLPKQKSESEAILFRETSYIYQFIQHVSKKTTEQDLLMLVMKSALKILNADYAGYELLRQQILNRTPKYGNDDDKGDRLPV